MGEIVSFEKIIEEGMKTSEDALAPFDVTLDKIFDEATQELPEEERIVRNVLGKGVVRVIEYLLPEDLLDRRVEEFDNMSDEESAALRDEIIKVIDTKTGSHLAELLAFED